ncbi:GTP pyrophosphokinase [Streptomyces albogriseolus]|uniref:GTP pyrophosphokinase n=1 Tax=Streptomyces albogriseolus TaxID=1887 RepID=UPI003CE7C57C
MSGEKDWGSAYSAQKFLYERYCEKLKDLLTQILTTHKIEFVQMEARTKEVASFVEKIQKKGGKYKDPMSEVTDLVGIRIIAYYLEDIERVARIIRREFSVLEEHSGDKQAELADNEFGYSSFHLVLKLGENRAKLLEWGQFADLKAEVQVRTALQHAWAAVNHKLDYKNSQDSPRELRRRLFRLSALFELADEEFSQIRTAGLRISADYEREIGHGGYDLEVNVDSVAAWAKIDPVANRIKEIAQHIGWPMITDPDLIPSIDRTDLVRLASSQGMQTIGDLRDYLQEVEQYVEPVLRKLSKIEGDHPASSIEDLVTQVILVCKKLPVEVWNDYYQQADEFKEARSLIP